LQPRSFLHVYASAETRELIPAVYLGKKTERFSLIFITDGSDSSCSCLRFLDKKLM